MITDKGDTFLEIKSYNRVEQEATGQTESLGPDVKLYQLSVSLSANREERWRARKTSLTRACIPLGTRKQEIHQVIYIFLGNLSLKGNGFALC